MAGVCLIIGAGPGIGQACAFAFAREGYDVAVAARHPERLTKLCTMIGELTGRSGRCYAADAGDADSILQLIADVTADMGEPEVLIFNAAVTHRGRPTLVKPEDWIEDYRSNVVGALVSAQAVAPAMKARNKGTILLTGGGFAHQPSAVFSSLSATKAALRSLTFTLAQELGGHGIHVATVTVYGVVQTGSAFDPTRIAHSFLTLHRQRRGKFETELIYK